MFEEAVCLAFQTPVLQGRSILRVARAQPSVCLLRRRVRLDAMKVHPSAEGSFGQVGAHEFIPARRHYNGTKASVHLC
jgi:hypothetical protein